MEVLCTSMTLKNTGTVLRVFAIKPIIIIACVIHCFCVIHKKFNGQQFFKKFFIITMLQWPTQLHREAKWSTTFNGV